MTSRTYTYSQTLEREVKILYGRFSVGATGAVGTTKGNVSVVRNSAGNYTITFDNKYNRLLGFESSAIGPSATGIAAIQLTAVLATYQDTFKTTGAITIQCYDYAGAAADPASGSSVNFIAHVRNTDVTVGNDG